MSKLKKKACKGLSAVLSIMMTASAFTGFMTTNVSATTANDQSGNYTYTNLEDGTIEITNCTANGDVDIPSVIDGKKVTSIGSYAFKDGITSVSIPESVVTIQNCAFNNCYSLKDIKFSEGLKYIRNSAFYGCSKIEKLDFPETLEEIGALAFNSSYSVYEINLPKTQGVKLNNYVFPAGAWYTQHPDGPIISGKTFLRYKSSGSDINEYTIPYGIESIATYAFSDLDSTKKIDIPNTVKYISQGAFSGTDIEEIVIPDGVEAIEDYTFAYCNNLQKVTLPDTITYIGNYSFEECRNLTNSFTLPKNLTYIGSGAFLRCTNLTGSLAIPKNVTYIDRFAFKYCGISEFTLAEDNKITHFGYEAVASTNWYNSHPNGPMYIGNILINFKSTTFTDTETINIKDGTKVIADSALRGFAGKITVPDSVKYINPYAFSNSSATNEAIPAYVEDIGENAFEYCLDITEFTVPQNIKTIKEFTFSRCKNLTNVYGIDKLVSIEQFAFESTNIKSFTIGSELTEFNSSAFNGNTVLESFTVDSNNKYFSAKDGVLYNKDQTAIICYPPAKKDATLIITPELSNYADAFSCGNNYVTEIIFEEGVSEIPEFAFYNFTNIEKITIPSTTTKVGRRTFNTDSALHTINYNAVDCEATDVFCEFKNLTTVNFGTKVRVLPGYIFYNCKNLKNINFSGNIEFIDTSAFEFTPWKSNLYNCADGEIVYVDKVAFVSNNAKGNIKIKDGTKSIFSYLFDNNSNITSVTLPDSLETIGKSAFSCCFNLKTINLSNIKYIDSFAFAYCENLKNIDLSNKLTYLGNNAFTECSSIESIVIPSGLKIIDEHTFSHCSNLKTITLEEGIETIEPYAFAFTDSLKSVKLPSTINKINYNAFYYSGLVNAELNEGLETIGSNIFDYCKALETIVIPSTVKTIEYGSFNNCTQLKSIILKEGLTNINSSAFYNCNNLTEILIPSTVKYIDSYTFNRDMIIYGYEGSYAQKYVDEHMYGEDLNHTFVAIERTMGDINGDGIVTITDATDLQKYLAGMITLTDRQLACADVTGNGKIDIKDVSYITKALAGIVEL